RRVAEGTLNADRAERVAVLIEETRHAEDRIRMQQLEGGAGVIEIDRSVPDALNHVWRKSIRVDFQADGQRGSRADAIANPAMPVPFDGEMEPEGVPPECLVAERVEPERVPPLADHAARTREDRVVIARAASLGALVLRRP